jgi:hypothetical protein
VLAIVSGAVSVAAGTSSGGRLISRAGLAAAKSNVVVDGVRLRSLAPVPPDPTGAVSRRFYVENVNDRVAVYRRSDLHLVSELNLNRFWHLGAYPAQDPQIAWDAQSRRWYASAMFRAKNALVFGWSKTANPTDFGHGWCRFHTHENGKLFADFPMLGFSRRHVIIGATMGDDKRHVPVTGRIWAMGAPAKGATGCQRPPLKWWGSRKHPLRKADGRVALTPVPAREVRPSDQGWVFAPDCPGEDTSKPGEESCQGSDPEANQVSVWRVAGTRAAPRLTRTGAIDVPRFDEPRPVPQPGSKDEIDPSDTRLSLAIMNRDPTLGGVDAAWFSHAVAGPKGRALIHWYEIDPRHRTILRRGTVKSRGGWAVYPAISPTWAGDSAVLDYVSASRRKLPEIRARYSTAGDPAGALLDHDTRLAASAATMAQCEKPCRYGDYAGASPDPRRPNVVWGTNEFIGPRLAGKKFRDWPNWKTRNFAISSPPGAGRP